MGMGWNLGNNLDAYEEDPDYGQWLMFEGFNELNDGGWGHSAESLHPHKKARPLTAGLSLCTSFITS